MNTPQSTLTQHHAAAGRAGYHTYAHDANAQQYGIGAEEEGEEEEEEEAFPSDDEFFPYSHRSHGSVPLDNISAADPAVYRPSPYIQETAVYRPPAPYPPAPVSTTSSTTTTGRVAGKKERPAPAYMPLWRCELCGDTVSVFMRDEHCRERNHLRAVRMTGAGESVASRGRGSSRGGGGGSWGSDDGGRSVYADTETGHQRRRVEHEQRAHMGAAAVPDVSESVVSGGSIHTEAETAYQPMPSWAPGRGDMYWELEILNGYLQEEGVGGQWERAGQEVRQGVGGEYSDAEQGGSGGTVGMDDAGRRAKKKKKKVRMRWEAWLADCGGQEEVEEEEGDAGRTATPPAGCLAGDLEEEADPESLVVDSEPLSRGQAGDAENAAEEAEQSVPPALGTTTKKHKYWSQLYRPHLTSNAGPNMLNSWAINFRRIEKKEKGKGREEGEEEEGGEEEEEEEEENDVERVVALARWLGDLSVEEGVEAGQQLLPREMRGKEREKKEREEKEKRKEKGKGKGKGKEEVVVPASLLQARPSSLTAIPVRDSQPQPQPQLPSPPATAIPAAEIEVALPPSPPLTATATAPPAPAPAPAPSPPSQAPTRSASPRIFFCAPCNTSLTLSYRIAHFASQTHLKNAQSQARSQSATPQFFTPPTSPHALPASPPPAPASPPPAPAPPPHAPASPRASPEPPPPPPPPPPAPTHIPPLQPTPRRPIVSYEVYLCEPCNVYVAVSIRSRHLAGLQHQRSAQVWASTMRAVRGGPPPPAPPPSSAVVIARSAATSSTIPSAAPTASAVPSAVLSTASKTFFCDPCNMSFELADRAVHLNGKKHMKKLRTAAIAHEEVQRGPTATQHTPGGEVKCEWRCNVCKEPLLCEEMVSHKAWHCRGAGPPTPAPAPPPPPQPPTRSTTTTSTLSSTTFFCDPCNKSFALADRAVHLNGKKHMKKLRTAAIAHEEAQRGPTATQHTPAVLSPPPPQHPTAASTPRPAQQEFCAVCNAFFLVSDMATHRTGKTHLLKAAGPQAPLRVGRGGKPATVRSELEEEAAAAARAWESQWVRGRGRCLVAEYVSRRGACRAGGVGGCGV